MSVPDTGYELPAHIADTVSTMARVQSEHAQGASLLDRGLARITTWLAHPIFIAALTVGVLAWVALNLALPLAGYPAPDPPPFPILGSIVTLAALYVALIILSTQRREDQLTTRREQLTLELAIVIEQKNSKLIALMEKLRVDHPNVINHNDVEAQAMSSSVDPHTVLKAIKDSHDPGARTT